MSRLKPEWFTFDQLALVADAFDTTASNLAHERRRDLEKTDAKTLGRLNDALEALAVPVVHFAGPRELAEAAAELKDSLVLSIYGGERSRNRMALVPAACETHGLAAIGPDVYGRVICQDKEISRRLATDCGLRVPRARVIRTQSDCDLAAEFGVPVVVKPLMEGSSIGIGPHSLVRSGIDARTLARELLEALRQPVLVEEFVGGREVSYNVIESADGFVTTFTEIVVEGDPNHFDTNLFDAEEKLERRLERRVRLVDDTFDEADRAAADALLRIIQPFGYCRVDGKLKDGKFFFLELTPDAWIAPSGAFAAGFIERGWAYEDVIKAVLTSRRRDPQDR